MVIKFFKEIFRDLIPFFLLVFVFANFFFSGGYVPSGSMDPTLKKGDLLCQNICFYGGQTPNSIGIPNAPTTIFGIPTYLPWIQIPSYRAPGFNRSLNRGKDIITFHESAKPEEDIRDIPVQRRRRVIKRFVAKAKDKVTIKNGRILVNGNPDPGEAYRQYELEVSLSKSLPSQFLRKHTNKYKKLEESEGRSRYELTMTKKQIEYYKKNIAASFDECFPDDTPCPKETWALKESKDAPFAHDIEEFIVPYKGMTIALDRHTHPLYLRMIEKQELHFYTSKVPNKKDKKDKDKEDKGYTRFFYKGRQIHSYTFQEDCLFVIGDNWNHSFDSRFWGGLPKSHLVGKLSFVALSLSTPKIIGISSVFLCFLAWLIYEYTYGDPEEEEEDKKELQPIS